MTGPGEVRIGISGWRYPRWRGTFYPEWLAQKNEHSFASGILNSIEINGTFYSLQRPEHFAAWADATPADFVFSVKGPRYITHLLRLKNAKIPLANFFTSGVLRMGAKLGLLRWQFPPSFRFESGRLEDFFALLPHDKQQRRWHVVTIINSRCGRRSKPMPAASSVTRWKFVMRASGPSQCRQKFSVRSRLQPSRERSNAHNPDRQG